jgi:hypothetical protein
MLSRPSSSYVRPVLRLAGLLAALALPPAAQAQEAEPPRPFCRRGEPAPACRAFLVAHLNFYPEWDADARDPAEPWRLAEWEVGVMVNHRPGQAAGAAVAVGTSRTGFHLAIKGRYRVWLIDGLALDAGAGVLWTQHPPRTYARRNIVGPTADATVGLTDWAAVSARAYTLAGGARDGGTLSGVDLGVRLGTRPGLVVTVVGLAALLLSALSAS